MGRQADRSVVGSVLMGNQQPSRGIVGEFVQCQLCGALVKSINDLHLLGPRCCGIPLKRYRELFPYAAITSLAARVRSKQPKRQAEESVKCLICGKLCYTLNSHIKWHGYTVEQYQKEFPGAPMLAPWLSECTSKQVSARNKEWYKDPSNFERYRKRMSRQNKERMSRLWKDEVATMKMLNSIMSGVKQSNPK